MTSTLANIQLGTSVATLDGLAVIDADQIYDNNQPINLSQYVPYVGSTQLTNLNSQNIQTSHVPTTGNDLTNKAYVDTAVSGLSTTYVPYTGSTSSLDMGTNNVTAQNVIVGNATTAGTLSFGAPSGYLPWKISTDSSGKLKFRTASGSTPILFSIDNVGNITTSQTVYAGTAQFTGITSATPALALGVDGSGNLNTFTVPSSSALLNSNNIWGNTFTNNFNNALKTVNAPFTNNNPGINAESITAISPSTYTLVSGFWRFVAPSATTGSVQLPGDFTYGATANQKYILTLTGCSTNGTAPVVGTVYNATTSTTISDVSQTITSTSQTITITFTVGTAPSIIYISFSAGATNYYVQWSSLSITQANTEVVGALQLDSPIISNITQATGTSTNLAGGLLVNQTSMSVSAATFTQTGMPSGAPTSTLSYSAPTYTLTASGTFATWLGSATTYISGAKYYFSFGMMLGSQYIQLQIVQYNTAGTAFAYIGDNVYGIPSSSSTISGSFSAGANGSYTGAIVFYFTPTIASQNVKFNTFSMTRADTSITGNEAVGGALTVAGGGTVNGTIQITNGIASPSVGILGGSGDRLILFAGTSSVYPYSLGINAGTLWYSAPTSSTHNWYIGGNSCMNLISTGVSFTTQNASGTNTTISKWRSNNTASEFNFYQQVTAGAYHALCQAGDFLMASMDVQNGISSTAGIVIAGWNQAAGIRIGTGAITMNGTVNTNAGLNVNGDIVASTISVYGYGRVDNRAMNSKVTGGGLNQFAFGSWANDTSAPFADCIFMNNWVDGSGGNTNILMVNKGGFGIRQYQGAFGSSATMTSYQDACMKGVGDNTKTTFQPIGGTWNAPLVVGSGTDSGVTQVITTNGNLHLDAAGAGNSIYYGYYANSRGTPNTHQFYGTTINFVSGLPQQTDTYSYPVVMCGASLCRSQAMMRLSYQNNTIGWGGGVNISYCFYRYNAQVSVKISGKLSYYVGGGGFAYPYIRLYSQSSGAVYYYSLQAYTNNTYNHMTFPFELVIYPASVGNTTGWFDVYVYNNGGCITDTGDQLWVNTEILPGSDY